MKAKTKAELEEIIKPSTPRYSGGAFYPGSFYHVEEEELILWSRTSLKAPLIPQEYKRYQELFEKYVSSEAKDIAAQASVKDEQRHWHEAGAFFIMMIHR